MQLQPQKQVQHFTALGLPMYDLPSELNCLFIFNFQQQDKHLPQNLGKRPIRVTFKRSDLKTITVQKIREYYLKLLPASAKRKNIRFTLSKGFMLKLRSSLAEVKNMLRRPSIDGIVLYTFEGVNQMDSDDQAQQEDYKQQCGIMNFIHQQQQFNAEYQHTIHFNLPNSNYVISITLSPQESVETLQNLFFKEVHRVFGQEITNNQVKEFKIRESKKVLKQGKAVGKHSGLFDDSQIDVVLDSKVKLEQVKVQYYPITLIKEWINLKTNTKMTKAHVINYYDVRGMQISKIREVYFSGQENPNNPSCLKIMEFILKPTDRLKKLDKAVLKLQDLGIVRLVGHFITEKMLFYRNMGQVLKNGASEFSLDQLEIPQQEEPVKKRCQKLVSERLKKIQPGYFKDRSRVQPILIYTSELKYKDKKSLKVISIYSSLSQYLRNVCIFDIKSEEMANQWVYRYASTLLKHLKNIDQAQAKVFRGVDYDPNSKEGDLMTFKPFTSTSRQLQVSLNFAIQRLLEKQQKGQKAQNPVITIFEMEIISGKPISKFSCFGGAEEEYLLEPYTQFVVQNVKSKKYRYPDIEGGVIYTYRHYLLKQVISSRDMPKVSNNYILWIDEKPNEGIQTFNRFIEKFTSPTVLFQIRSTQQLRKWLKQRTQIIADTYQNTQLNSGVPSKILFVTNMVRTENGQRNFYAGVDAINSIREVIPNIPIIVYVGDKQAAENNLNDKQVSRENIEVVKQFEDFIKCVESHLDLKFNILPKKEQKQKQKQPQLKGNEKPNKISCQMV